MCVKHLSKIPEAEIRKVAFPLIVLALCASLVGCTNVPERSEDSPEPSPTVATTEVPSASPSPAMDRQSQYKAAVQGFPYTLPAGFSFPAEAPEDGWGEDGADVARYLWGCFTIRAAWEHALGGDRVAADAMLAILDEDTTEWDIPGLRSSDWSENMRFAGDSGLCAQWENEQAE
ncbi:hypothetical protein LJR042_002563 [Microbacterium maritypicum]